MSRKKSKIAAENYYKSRIVGPTQEQGDGGSPNSVRRPHESLTSNRGRGAGGDSSRRRGEEVCEQDMRDELENERSNDNAGLGPAGSYYLSDEFAERLASHLARAKQAALNKQD